MGGLRSTGRLLPTWRLAGASIARTRQGFTIVEVLIVLAVSGALFVAAAILISGKQNQAGFNQAIQQIRSQIEQSLNEVAVGYFPGNANFQCSAPAGGPVTLTAGASGQGANAGCIFAGKALQFQVHGTAPEQYGVFTLAGVQKDATGKEVTTLAGAAPKVVARGTASPPGYPDITVSTVLQNGLTTAASPPAGMWYNDGGSDVNIGAVAFVPTFAQYTGSDIDSASQQVNVVAIPGTALNNTLPQAADAINANVSAGVVNPSNGVSICFDSGGTNQSGLVTIGGGTHPLSVTLKIFTGSRTCGK